MIQGDIAAQSADALVNAAGTSLEMGSGVAGFDLEDGACIIGETVADSRPNASMTSGPSATATTRSRRYGAARTGPTAETVGRNPVTTVPVHRATNGMAPRNRDAPA